jgi:hypothetical protein
LTSAAGGAIVALERKRLVNEIEKHRRALGEGEELRRAAPPFFEPEASGRLAQRGLKS